MYYTYILKCKTEKGNNLYIGSTADLRERLKDHKTKSVFTTKKFINVELIYYEACNNKTDALIREKQLKTGFGRGYIKRRLKNDIRMRD
ncbi:GIY-YIG nuclease family protein [Candidatus Roizmanbacteria bacterium]|nr:GIY-YIG nuclease family protein [Candidatus Roizmanbacteria bacterium]